MFEATLGTYLSIASAAASAYATVDQARQQNEAIEASYRSQQDAARVQRNQVEAAASTEKAKRRERAEQIEGRLRVAGGEAGIGLGGSIEALSRQADADLIRNNAIIDQNVANQIALIESGRDANLAQLEAQTENTLIAGFAGGVQGFSTGLSIASAVESLDRRNKTTLDPAYTPVPKPNI